MTRGCSARDSERLIDTTARAQGPREWGEKRWEVRGERAVDEGRREGRAERVWEKEVSEE